ncbi:DotA/TraY family protein [Pandoraea sp. NPDC090278]|uniref:DotA/TraY family protein n=1 Tax=Pandoraea sp. NPDC090278 TaxID=3364391 RepID=UPI00383BE6BC
MKMKHVYRQALVSIGLYVFTSVAFAQGDAGASLDGMMSATPASDQSIQMLRYVFGSFADNPFGSFGGIGDSLIGQLFYNLNVFVFLVAGFWSAYTIGASIVQTANEGQFLGQRFSTVWYPVRMIWGAATLIPIFGGFGLGQCIYMYSGLASVGAANLLTNTAIEQTAKFTEMVQAPTISPATSSATAEMADNLYQMWLCQQVLTSRTDVAPNSQVQLKVITGGIQLGSAAEPTLCGRVTVTPATSFRSANTLGFSVNSVNYQGIANAVAQNIGQAHQTALVKMSNDLALNAQSWYGKYQAAKTSGQPIAGMGSNVLEAVRITYNEAVRQSLHDLLNQYQTKALTDQAIQNMKATGWIGIGAWYSTFAEVNAAMADATKVEIHFSPPTTTDSEYVEALAAFRKSLTQMAGTGQAAGATDAEMSAGSLATRLIKRAFCENETGNLSIGQCFVGAGMSAVYQNSGGNGLVDPIIASKNFGDYLMTGAETLLVVAGGIEIAMSTADAAKSLLAGKAVGFFSGGLSDIAIGALKAVGKVAVKLIYVFMIPLFVVGLSLAVYLPLVPFIAWFSGVLTWFASFIESLIASPLWSMVHLEGEGEGMGRRSQHGYLFLANMLLRAPLMVIAFFVASAGTRIGGTILYFLFSSAVANAQGNSVTGLATIVGLLIIFAGLNILVVQMMFNVVHVIPDQVIGWLGGNVSATLGRELENRVNAMFVKGASHAQTGMVGKGAGGGGGKKPTPPGGGGSGPKRKGD